MSELSHAQQDRLDALAFDYDGVHVSAPRHDGFQPGVVQLTPYVYEQDRIQLSSALFVDVDGRDASQMQQVRDAR